MIMILVIYKYFGSCLSSAIGCDSVCLDAGDGFLHLYVYLTYF